LGKPTGSDLLTPRSGMSELPADSSVPPTGAANDNGDVPQAEVGGGRREPAPAQPVEARDRPMAAAREGPEGRRRSRPGNSPGLAALPYLRLRHPLGVLGINYQQFLRHYLEHYPIAPGRIQELEGRRRRFVEACRAREAAFDAEYQRNPQRMDFDILTFSITLTASEIINPLIEELGCDKFIGRE
uniref:EP300 interacting inhibitor of differentiation 2 n=1 Tax=Balaenoptera musculus TaxID=9771 RepID=A0A8C0E0P5_BALMU